MPLHGACELHVEALCSYSQTAGCLLECVLRVAKSKMSRSVENDRFFGFTTRSKTARSGVKTVARIPQQLGLLHGVDRAEVMLSTVREISRLLKSAPEIAVRPEGSRSQCVALDERCCEILRWGDVLAMWCCNGTLWRIAWHVVVMITSRDRLFRVHEANHFVTS